MWSAEKLRVAEQGGVIQLQQHNSHPKKSVNKSLGAFFVLSLFEFALVLVRLDHVASIIVNANHGAA